VARALSAISAATSILAALAAKGKKGAVCLEDVDVLVKEHPEWAPGVDVAKEALRKQGVASGSAHLGPRRF
jgi:hypothetical protein